MSIKGQLYNIYYSLMQKKYRTKAGINIHYIFKRHRVGCKEKLIVVFSGFAGHEQRGRFNYVRTLNNSKSDLLFIRDDFGYNHVGSYYLGNHCELFDSNAIQELLQEFTYGYKTVVFAGSSKGGSAALIYGILMNADVIISGSPQFLIGNYLISNEYHKKILDGIINGSPHTLEWLNKLIENCIMNHKYDGVIKLVYSSNEESWENDVKYFVDLVRRENLQVELIDEHFENHSDVGIHFIKYLKSI